MKKAKSPARWSEDTWAAIFAVVVIVGAAISFYLYHFYTGRR